MNFIKRHPFITVLLIVLSIYIFINYLRPIKENPLIDKDSIHYVNSLYYTGGHAYENLLNSESEKKLYLKMVKDIDKAKGSLTFDLNEYDCPSYGDCFSKMSSAFAAIELDHPELLIYESYSVSYKEGVGIRINYNNAIKFEWYAFIKELRIARIVDDIRKKTEGMSEYGKVKYVYEWISEKDYDFSTMWSGKNQSAYTVFSNGTGVCAAFAKASQIILQNIGMKSYLVIGVTTGHHMWNIFERGESYMAAILAHYLSAELYNNKYSHYVGEDLKAFLVGSVAVDAPRNQGKGMSNREITHFGASPSKDLLNNMFNLDGGVLDFDTFFEKYGDKLDNPFIEGYLLHLCTDRKWFSEVITELLNKNASEIKESATNSNDLTFLEALTWYGKNLYQTYNIHDILFSSFINMKNIDEMCSYDVNECPMSEIDKEDLSFMLDDIKIKCENLKSQRMTEESDLPLISIEEMDDFLESSVKESRDYISKKII